jgi:ubiquinone/menaquinone biosynthesis C-methylase UbiE
VNEAALRSFDPARLDQLRLDCCDMTRMPYATGMFDIVYCISVLEHVKPAVQVAALQEFARVMKDDGLIVMTVDYPTVNIDQLSIGIAQTGLRFAGKTDFSAPANAISSTYWGPELKCIRLILCKDN